MAGCRALQVSALIAAVGARSTANVMQKTAITKVPRSPKYLRQANSGKSH